MPLLVHATSGVATSVPMLTNPLQSNIIFLLSLGAAKACVAGSPSY